VNPAHLWAGTVQQNLYDARRKGRASYIGSGPGAEFDNPYRVVHEWALELGRPFIRSEIDARFGTVYGWSYKMVRKLRRARLLVKREGVHPATYTAIPAPALPDPYLPCYGSLDPRATDRVFAWLEANPGPHTARAICDGTGKRLYAIVRLLGRLEWEGRITRTGGPGEEVYAAVEAEGDSTPRLDARVAELSTDQPAFPVELGAAHVRESGSATRGYPVDSTAGL
jgi:hypothetical protein